MAKWTETALAAGRIDVCGRRIAVRSDGFSKTGRQAFLDTLATTCCVKSAIAAAGVTSTTVYAARRREPDFAAAWQDALAAGYDAVERKLLRYVVGEGAPGPDDGGPIEAADDTAQGGGDRTETATDVRMPAWVLAGMMLMKRHGAAVHGRRAGRVPALRATAAETDAALARRLDTLALRTRDRT